MMSLHAAGNSFNIKLLLLYVSGHTGVSRQEIGAYLLFFAFIT